MNRPDPDTLLRSLAPIDTSAGKLKIYLGMAAGVGKTFAMLTDGALEQKRGIDVVAGYVEPHGRIETESLSIPFEQIPILALEHNGVAIREFDLLGALKRKPTLILVDELAHTNADGVRNHKRWQDIFDLLDAGINVFTTLNVQHLESLNDVVQAITGVAVRETIPDSVLKRADKIELIDIPPDELVLRLKEGKIYPLDKVDAALRNFFKEGNLLSLREIALRKTAEKIDAELLSFRDKNQTTDIWPTAEKIVVAIAPNKFARRLVRAAARIAQSKHAELIVVYVATPTHQFLKKADFALIEDALDLATQLGASIERRSGVDIVEEILSVSVERNATQIVVGKPIRSRIREMVFGSIADDLIRRSGSIDIHLITGQREEATAFPILVREDRPRFFSVLTTLLFSLVATGVSALLYPDISYSNISLFYLVASVSTAFLFGKTECVIAAVVNILAFNFFFIPPRFSFGVEDPQIIFTFLVMLFISLLLSSLTLRLRNNSKLIAERERRLQLLFELGTHITVTRHIPDIAAAMTNAVRKLSGCDACLLIKQQNKLVPTAFSNSQFEMLDGELSVAKLALEKAKMTGAGTDVLPGSQGLYLPLRTGTTMLGVLGLNISSVAQFDYSLLPTIELVAQQGALSMHRIALEEEMLAQTVSSTQQKTRNLLLRSVSHDLRTPLTVVQGAAQAIIENAENPNTVKTFAQDISEHAARLNRIVRNVLSLTRLEGGEVVLKREWCDLEEILLGIKGQIEERVKPRKLLVTIQNCLPSLFLDYSLFQQLFMNLTENSVQHAVHATFFSIDIVQIDMAIVIRISDDGPGLPIDASPDLENAAFRPDTKESKGTGLGLLIVRSIIELHQGTFTAQNVSPHGVVFEIILPCDRSSPESFNH